ncbi:hypothetical protein ACIPY6_09320 [Streptomyces sp. NPDC090054]|uniref:hypothetical protein n=1 Tax=Streptomyces sp. NPDC090054 TaxID=3365933 RepID=UPI0037FAB603
MRRTTIDGIPVHRIPSTGPLRFGLRFGCGVRDETYRTLGASQVVERLTAERAGAEAGAGLVTYGSLSDLDETRFYGSGAPEEVVRFLESVCRTLSDLPLDRLEHVAGILEIENTAPVDVRAAQALSARYGARALGLAGQRGPGHRALTADMVREHAATHFTRGNAVLLLSGPEPEGLRLPLPDGARPPRRAPRRLAGHVWAQRDTDGIALALDAPIGSAAARMGHCVLMERVDRLLRERLGISSHVDVVEVSRDALSVERILVLDAAGGKEAAVAAALWGEAVRMAQEPPLPGELMEYLTWLRRTWTEQPDPWARLQEASNPDLYGIPYLDDATALTQLGRVTPQEVREAMRAALEGALLVVPVGVHPSLTGLDGRRLEHTGVCEVWDTPFPPGEVFRRPLLARATDRGARGDRLVLTPHSVVHGRDDWYHEYRFDEVVELEQWGWDRTVVARCGCSMRLVRGSHTGDDRVRSALDRAVPSSRIRVRTAAR